MRKLLLGLLFVSVSGLAQNPADVAVKKLYTAFHDIDIDYLSEHLCSKSEGMELYGKLDNYFLNADQKFRYVMTNAKYDYAPTKIIEAVTYQPFKFRNVVRVTYFKPVDVAAKQSELKDLFAAQSVTYEKARNSFLIVYQAKMLAYSAANGDWKFAILDNTIPGDITDGCLPEAVKKELGL